MLCSQLHYFSIILAISKYEKNDVIGELLYKTLGIYPFAILVFKWSGLLTGSSKARDALPHSLAPNPCPQGLLWEREHFYKAFLETIW